MNIGAACVDDAAAVTDLWAECGLTRPWNDPDRDFRTALSNPTSEVLVMRTDAGRVGGSIMVGFDGHRGWFYYLGVLPGLRGRGIGGRLVAEAESWLRGRGAAKAQLMVRADNADVVRFYERLGYEDQNCLVLGKRFRTVQGSGQ